MFPKADVFSYSCYEDKRITRKGKGKIKFETKKDGKTIMP